MRFKTEFASVSKGGLTFEADEDGIIEIPDLHVHQFADSIGGILQHAPALPAAKPETAAQKKAREKAEAEAEAKAKADAEAAAKAK